MTTGTMQKPAPVQKKHTGSCHGVTDISKYSKKDQWGFIKSIKHVLHQSNPAAMVSYLYPDSQHLFEKVTKDKVTIYGTNWTFHTDSDSIRQVVIGRNCDNVLPDTIETHQLNHREGKLPIDIDLGPNKVVSRKHILIHKVPGNDKDWYLNVLGRNSCKMNSRRVSNKRLKAPIGPLKSGTILDVGDTQMMICFGNDPFPFITLPYYSHLIPKLMMMYGLNGNNNPLLRDIINTSTYVKKQRLQLNVVDHENDNATEEENILESTVMEDNLMASTPKKNSLVSSPIKEKEEGDAEDDDDVEKKRTTDVEPIGSIEPLSKRSKLDPKIQATSFYSNTDKSDSAIINTPSNTPTPKTELLKRPLTPSNSNEEESLVKKMAKKHQENNNNHNNNNSYTNTTKRPSWPYTTLITRAILSRPEACMPLNSIYEYISTLHPYYDMSVKKWQNSVRHNLSVHSTFVKIRHEGTGSLWALNDEVVQEFLENWYQGNLIKLKKTAGGVTKELCLFMSKETNRFPGQKDPQFYKDAYKRRMESEKKDDLK